MSDRPPFIYQPPSQLEGSGNSQFTAAPKPIFAQRYIEADGTFHRHRIVDIGNRHFSLLEQEMASLEGMPGVVVGKPGRIPVAFNMNEYQQIRFGSQRASEGDDTKAFRGYLMIEPELLYEAFQRLHSVGKSRLKDGKHLEYKWEHPMIRNMVELRMRELQGQFIEALYNESPNSALVTLYSDTPEEIKEIFLALVTDADWQTIEDKKREIFAGLKASKPLHGMARFSYNGSEFYTLELNHQPGFAEDL